MKRTPEQIAAIETLAKRVCVDAGAGSGKTSVLIDRIVHLIERNLNDASLEARLEAFTRELAAPLGEARR